MAPPLLLPTPMPPPPPPLPPELLPATAAAVTAHLNLFEHCAVLQRHVCMDRRRTCGTGPDSTDGHHGGGQQHRASCHYKLHLLILGRNGTASATNPSGQRTML